MEATDFEVWWASEGWRIWREVDPDGVKAHRETQVEVARRAFEAGRNSEREACANISPNDLNISAAAMPHEVWTKYRGAIRERSNVQIKAGGALPDQET